MKRYFQRLYKFFRRAFCDHEFKPRMFCDPGHEYCPKCGLRRVQSWYYADGRCFVTWIYSDGVEVVEDTNNRSI